VSAFEFHQEEWREIPAWPEYHVSSLGRVMRVAPAFGATPFKVLSQRSNNSGYMIVSLCRNSKKKDCTVHRLVASAFISLIPEGMDVCHNDGNKKNNCWQNLRIDTRRGNMSDTVHHGTSIRGERCRTNKYSKEKILAFRADFDSGMKVADAGRKHGIVYSYAYAIAKRVTWAWL